MQFQPSNIAASLKSLIARVKAARSKIKRRISVKQISRTTGRLGVGSSSTLRGSPKLQATAPVQRTRTPQRTRSPKVASASPQRQRSQIPTTKKPVVVKKTRVYQDIVLTAGGTIKVTNKAEGLTDAQWERKKRIIQKKKTIANDLEAFRRQYKDEFSYKSALYNKMVEQAGFAEEQVTRQIEEFARKFGEAAQKANDANSQEEWDRWYKEAVRYDLNDPTSYVRQYLSGVEESYQAWGEVTQSELDRSDVFPDTRGLWEKVVSNTLGKVWTYSLGSKGIYDFKRIANTVLNVADPNRTIYKVGSTEGSGQVKDVPVDNDRWIETITPDRLQRAWNASQEQRYGKFTNLNDLTKKERGVVRFLDFLYENALDPNWWVGAGEVRAFGKVVSGASKASELISGASDIVKASKAFKAARGSKFAKAGKWLTSEAVVGSRKTSEQIAGLKGVGRSLVGERAAEFLRLKQHAWKEISRGISGGRLRKFAPDVDWGYVGKIPDLDPKVVEMAQRIRLSEGVWRTKFPDLLDQDVAKWFSGFSESMKQQSQKLATELDKLADYMAKVDKSKLTKNYIPRVVYGDSYNFRKSKVLNPSRSYEDFAKALQSPDELFESVATRLTKSAWDTAPPEVVSSFSSAEKALLLNQTDSWKTYEKGRGLFDQSLEDVNSAVSGLRKKMKQQRRLENFNPLSVWRKAVTILRPAFYVNNEVSNQLFGLSGGGYRFVKYQKGYKKFLDEFADAADDIGTKIANDVGTGRLSKIATGMENRARVALYRALSEKGYSHDEALKTMNQWLFDYTVKNADRPFRALAPFWLWQKNLTKRVATMPIKSPRAAEAWRQAYSELYERPLAHLPDEDIVITDPDTGEVTIFNPREFYKGKLYNPIAGEWMNAPFLPFTQEQLASPGKNPILVAIDEWATNRDMWGNKLNGQKWYTSLAKAFPQFQLGKQLLESGVVPGVSKRLNEDKWLAQGTGFPKAAQGFDPSRSNYKEGLDPAKGLRRNLLAYLGVPKTQKFDTAKFKETKRYTDFNREFFSVDWTKLSFQAGEKRKKQIAQKYGFDLDKDIYNDKWTKYDTDFTKQQKKFKSEARAAKLEFWSEYNETPKGSRTEFVQTKRVEWEEKQAFIANPYFNVLQKWFVTSKNPDAQEALRYYEFWKVYWSSDRATKRRMVSENPQYSRRSVYSAIKSLTEAAVEHYRQAAQAKYRKTPKGQFWQAFFSIDDESERLKFYLESYKSEFGGKGLESREETVFWLKYYSANPDVKRLMLRENPQFSKFDDEPLTSEQYAQKRRDRRQRERDSLATDPDFQRRFRAKKREIIASVPGRRFRSKRVVYK